VPILVQASSVGVVYGGNEIFADLTFAVRDVDRIALVGENGSGKSSLLRLLAGKAEPQSGSVSRQRGLRVAYLPQTPALDPQHSVREIVALASGHADEVDARLRELEQRMGEQIDDDELESVLAAYAELLERADAHAGVPADARVEQTLTALGLPSDRWDLPSDALSGGEKQIVGLACCLLEEPELLLLDEPDNHLDADAKAWLESYLGQRKGGTVVISHDRYFIDRIATSIVELEDGGVVEYPGNYTAFVDQKRARLERNAQLYELRQREIKKLKASAEQLTQWARQNPKFAARAGNRWRILEIERERLAETPVPVLDRRRMEVEFNSERGSSLVLDIKGLSKSYGDRQVIRPFDLELTHGERVGVVGENGSGKTTFFRLILDREAPTEGRVRIGPSIVPGYYAQEQETLDPARTPLELVRSQRPMTEQQAIGFLVGLLFTREDALTPIGKLSGGERSRLQIALMVLGGANFLVLDEPTNNLDLGSIEELEDALLEFSGTILTISHDRYFLDRVCHRILEFADGYVREYPGGFTYYDRHRGEGRLLTQMPIPDRRRKR